jgi:hypothetical protein
MIDEAARRGLPDSVCQSNMAQMLAATLRISVPEAARRVRAAEAVGERMSMTGEPLSPVRPLLAAAQRDGEISAEAVGRTAPHHRLDRRRRHRPGQT